jgi:hypothetical protein
MISIALPLFFYESFLVVSSLKIMSVSSMFFSKSVHFTRSWPCTIQMQNKFSVTPHLEWAFAQQQSNKKPCIILNYVRRHCFGSFESFCHRTLKRLPQVCQHIQACLGNCQLQVLLQVTVHTHTHTPFRCNILLL